jgi:hypothetical protein
MGLEHNAAHAQGLGLGQPKKLRLAFALFGGKFEIDVAMNIDRAFHHVVVQSHAASLKFNDKFCFTTKGTEVAKKFLKILTPCCLSLVVNTGSPER